jgi:hypothetical protein
MFKKGFVFVFINAESLILAFFSILCIVIIVRDGRWVIHVTTP